MNADARQASIPRSEDRDEADQQRLRHARSRHLGFSVGRYLQPPPMLFTRDGHNVFLGDMYRGHSAFLLCGGPSLMSHNLELLTQRGIVTCAVNNAAAVFRPQLWVSVDDPGNFCEAIWQDPGIFKFVPLCHMEKRFTICNETEDLVPSEHAVGDMPSVFGFRRNESFHPEQWLYEDTFNWGNHSNKTDTDGNKGSRSVLLVALRLLFYLGVRRLYLVGCDFRMVEGQANYAFEQNRSAASVRSNNSSYRILNSRLASLQPYFLQEGYEVFNCTPDSGLKVYPYVAFEEAVDSAAKVVSRKIVTRGRYDRHNRHDGQATLTNLSGGADAITNEDPLRQRDLTLITAIDESNLERFRHTWQTWLRFRPGLADLPRIVVHDRGLDVDSIDLEFFGAASQTRFICWKQLPPTRNRNRWSRAYLDVAAREVTTSWFLKLEPEAIALPHSNWIVPEWFAVDASGRRPAFITSSWAYSKPADVIQRLDDWADQVPGLADFQRINLPFDQSQDRVRHETISTWCCFGNTSWFRQVAPLVTKDLPCDSFDTLVHYLALRRKDRYVCTKMKRYGWEHSFSARTDVIGRSRELLISN